MTNMDTKKKRIISMDEKHKANELNDFYLRFETQDYSMERNAALEFISDPSVRMVIDPHKIQSIFQGVDTKNPLALMVYQPSCLKPLKKN